MTVGGQKADNRKRGNGRTLNDGKPRHAGVCQGTPAPAFDGGNECRPRPRGGLIAKEGFVNQPQRGSGRVDTDISMEAGDLPVPQSSLSNPAAGKVFIGDLSLGREVDEIFMLAAARQGQARNGPYWLLDFRDASGSIGGKIWSPQSQAYPDLAAGMAVQVRGRVSSYRDKLELAVDGLRILGEEEKSALDMALFMPASARDPEAMLEELLALAKSVLTHKPWRKLIVSLLTDSETAPLLRLAPAAKAMHHAYAGGLLEHTLSVTRLCMRIADHYPHLDRQALFAGAVCHDLGKIWELTPGLSIDYTTTGRLIGHINLLVDKLGPFIKKAGLEPHLAEHLEHLILRHHGTHEFGSPRLPSTAEAMALHYADNIDAKLQQVADALEGVEEDGWSAYNPPLERFLYRAGQSPTPEARPRKEARSDDRAEAAKTQEPLSLFSPCSSLLKE